MSTNNPAYASPTYIGAPITGTQQATIDAGSVRELWKKGVETFEQTNDFFREFEGNSPMSLIQSETDTSKGAGQKITFTVKSGFYAEAHTGDELFTSSAHFEELKTSSNTLNVDWFRHGVRYTERTEEKMGMRGELMEGTPEELGKWLGRLKTEKLFMMFREKLAGENSVTLDGTLQWDPIVEYAQQMKRWGATSAVVGKEKGGKPMRRYCVLAVTDALTSLKLDPTYQSFLKDGGVRGDASYIFSGGFSDVDGHIIKEYESIEHDGYGAIGSPLNPMGRIGTARTAVLNTAPDYLIGGGSDYDPQNILVKPLKWFPNYAYTFIEGDVLTPSGTAFYVAVINSPSAAVDPNKWGFYKCTTNDGVKLTITEALASGAVAASGGGAASVTTLGGITYDALDHTNNHALDSLFVLVDEDAFAIFKTLLLGAACARRGYGKYRHERTTQIHEGGFVRDVYVKSVFGQAPRVNRKDRAPGVTVITHKGFYAGTPLPKP